MLGRAVGDVIGLDDGDPLGERETVSEFGDVGFVSDLGDVGNGVGGWLNGERVGVRDGDGLGEEDGL